MYDPPKPIEWHLDHQRRRRYIREECWKYHSDADYCKRVLDDVEEGHFGRYGYPSEETYQACLRFMDDRAFARRVIKCNDASKEAMRECLPWYVQLERTIVRFPSHFKRMIGIAP